jgi:hypothetical protein
LGVWGKGAGGGVKNNAFSQNNVGAESRPHDDTTARFRVALALTDYAPPGGAAAGGA